MRDCGKDLAEIPNLLNDRENWIDGAGNIRRVKFNLNPTTAKLLREIVEERYPEYINRCMDMRKTTDDALNMMDEAIARGAMLQAENQRLREALEKITQSKITEGAEISAFLGVKDIAKDALKGETK